MTTQNPQGNSPYVWRPHTVEEAWAIKQRFGEDACYVAGGTLLQLQWEAGAAKHKHLISLEGIEELTDIRESVDDEGMTIDIGALCRLGTCQGHPALVQHWPLLAAACHAVGAPAVRNRATLGGNVANGHGDTLTALLVLDGDLIWFGEGEGEGEGTATAASIASSFNGTLDASSASSRLLTGIRLHRPADQALRGVQRISLFRKLGRRAAFVPSLVTVAASLVRKIDGTAAASSKTSANLAPVEHVRLAVGAIDFPPRRLTSAEQLLEGATPHPDLWQNVHAHIMAEFDPPDSVFASADYRRLAAANVLVAQLATACSRSVKEEMEC